MDKTEAILALEFIEKYFHPVIIKALEPQLSLIRQALQTERVDEWQDIETAPRHEKLFLCRKKGENNIWEAIIYEDSESWEMPAKYDVLHNMYLDAPADDGFDGHEWKPLNKE